MFFDFQHEDLEFWLSAGDTVVQSHPQPNVQTKEETNNADEGAALTVASDTDTGVPPLVNDNAHLAGEVS